MTSDDPSPKEWLKRHPIWFSLCASFVGFVFGYAISRDALGASVSAVFGGLIVFFAWRAGGYGWTVESHQQKELERRGELGIRKGFLFRAVVGVLIGAVAMFGLFVLQAR